MDWILLEELRRVNVTYASVKLYPLLMFGVSVLGLNDSCIQSYVLHVDGGGCNFSYETGRTRRHEINNSLLVLCRGIWS